MRREICQRRVSEYMSPAVPVVSTQTTVHDAMRLINDHGYQALPVCDRGRFLRLVGEKELLKMVPSQATLLSRHEIAALLDRVTVGAVVKFPPATVSHDLTLLETAEVMLIHSSAVLPVLENGRYAGLISWEEILAVALGAPSFGGSAKEESCHTVS